MTSADVVIAAVPAAAVRPLRAAVLRPGQRPEELVYPGDDVPGAWHALARRRDRLAAGAGTGPAEPGAALGIVSISPESLPGDEQDGDWRIRGMATADQARGTGVGRLLLHAALDHARSHGGRRAWCNARVSAAGFYLGADFIVLGDEFDIPGIGPHLLMSRQL